MLVLIWLMLHANIWEHLHAARYAEDDMASHLHRAYALIVVVVVYALHSLPAPFRLEYAVSGFVLMVSGLIISWPLYRFGVASQYQEKG